MTTSSKEELLERIKAKSAPSQGAAKSVIGSAKSSETNPPQPRGRDEERLTNLLARISNLTSSAPGGESPKTPSHTDTKLDVPPVHAGTDSEPNPTPQSAGVNEPVDEFVPREPTSFEEAGLNDSMVEELALKYLLSCGSASGREVSDQVKLPFVLVERLLYQMKQDQLVVYRDRTEVNDYVYRVTEMGRERARRLVEECTYFGSAPVSLRDYVASVKAQSIAHQHPTKEDLQRAFSDLLVNQRMFDRLGPAINSGRGMFLFGYPGNGKTSIAERVTKAFGRYIWLPRAISIDGEIMRLFDPMNHDEAPLTTDGGLLDQTKVDKRWVRIKRPTIIVGGELTMDNLEVFFNRTTGISEAPLQLKSNCGTLVIDDLGRQRMSTDQLLNRWIVPLEKRYDFLNMGSGKKVQVPFDQLIVFSTNLEPKDLVDDAFLRRIPYKIEVCDPSEEEFRELFQMMCRVMKIPHKQEPIDYLIQHHYTAKNRPFRCCQPRDLLLQVRNHCLYRGIEPELTCEHFDFAAENYFAVM